MTGKIVGSRYYVDGREVTREEFDRAFPDQDLAAAPGTDRPGCWPMTSEAAAVHPKQVVEATRGAAERGVPTHFDRLGRPVFTSRAHRKAYLKAYGFRDNNGGYGD